MLRRHSPEPVVEEAPADPARAGKGRPTPTRKEAEAARRQSVKVPADPKAARKAKREREREARLRAREGLLAGDDRYLPARDAGPVRRLARDFVDSRRGLAEYFIFVAVAVIALSLVPVPALQLAVSLAWLLVTVLMVADVGWMLWRLRRELAQRWPDRSERKGALFYATLRSLQLRRMRLPKPKVRPGGAPAGSRDGRR